MEAAVVRQFLDFFQDFIHLCQSESWLNSNTSSEEIRNSIIISQHIEKCLNKLQTKSLLDEFLGSLSKSNKSSSAFFKNCFSDPPKFILKKILQSNVDTSQVEIGFTIFIDIFSESKLEECLSQIMLETASQEVLLKNLSQGFPKEKLIVFKSLLLLSELSNCDKVDEIIKNNLESYDCDTIEMLVMCLLNKDVKYENARSQIVNGFLNVMLSKNVSNKKFWNILFFLSEEQLINMCLYHSDICKAICKALIDCGRLINENMSSEFFYINLTYSELLSILHKLLKNDDLKIEFFDIVTESNSDLEFWNNALKS